MYGRIMHLYGLLKTLNKLGWLCLNWMIYEKKQ
jgi:hypothetical protein